jgi:hypothetical protein
MEFKGRYVVPSPPDAVWAALFDPDMLSRCIPGAQSVRQTGPGAFIAKAVLKVGPVKATFEGKVTVTEKEAPPGFVHAGTLSGEGQGGAAGFARGGAEVQLAAEGGNTILTYAAQAVIGGRLAQIGQRLIDGAAKALADEFFAKFAAGLSPPVQEPPAVEAAPASQAGAAPMPVSKPETDGLAPQIWIAGLIGIVIILLVVFGLVL